jgi:hypothetical protein
MVPDGLSNPNKLPDEVKIIDDSDLRRFTSVLQDAQRRAVQVGNEEAKKK